jgi:hypothetical protein
LILGSLLFIGFHLLLSPAVIMTYIFGGTEKANAFISVQPFWVGFLMSAGMGSVSYGYRVGTKTAKIVGFIMVLGSISIVINFLIMVLESS